MPDRDNENTPNLDNVKKELLELGITAEGTLKQLTKKLKSARASKKLKEMKANESELQRLRDAKPQPFDFYLICDVEATCTEASGFDYPNEIIEFPVIRVDGSTGEKIDTFHRYVRPTLNPALTPFCTQLTGITQETVDKAEAFDVVFTQFMDWIASFSADPLNEVVFCTDGPWDLRDFMQKEFTYYGITRPLFMRKIVNVRKAFADFYKLSESPNLNAMLAKLGMQFEGKEHSGMDDATNLYRIFVQMVKDGYRMDVNTDVHNKASGGGWKKLRK